MSKDLQAIADAYAAIKQISKQIEDAYSSLPSHARQNEIAIQKRKAGTALRMMADALQVAYGREALK